ncbi:MAG TPA: AAA family ATPase [Polyangiales bacterium]|nr:AAA family ATPase [Polyangiales bacterium]
MPVQQLGHMNDAPLDEARRALEALGRRARAVVIGRDDVIELVLIALVSDGHVLLEDYPGSGKTTLARALGDSLRATAVGSVRPGAAHFPAFRRIQFTPDLLPSDVTGSSIFELDKNRFTFRPGPIFAHIVLADEINRTSPKVQAAMLEAMAEKQVTVDNDTHKLDELFFVIATQNPLDVMGTYPLPTPQLDRFLFKIEMRHIEKTAELEVLAQYPRPSLSMSEGLPQVTRDELVLARRIIREQVHIAPVLREALVDVARALRADERVLQGASTRSLVLMLPALQARAVLRGRNYVTPDDVEALAPHVFGHRIECVPGVIDKRQVIAAALAPTLERLSKLSLGR